MRSVLLVAGVASGLGSFGREVKNHPQPFVLAVVPTKSVPAIPAAYLGLDYDYINDDRDYGLALAAYPSSLGNAFTEQFVLINGYLSTLFVPDDTDSLYPWNATVPKPGRLVRLTAREPVVRRSGFDMVRERHRTFLAVHGEIERTFYMCNGDEGIQVLAYEMHHNPNCTRAYLAVFDQGVYPDS